MVKTEFHFKYHLAFLQIFLNLNARPIMGSPFGNAMTYRSHRILLKRFYSVFDIAYH